MYALNRIKILIVIINRESHIIWSFAFKPKICRLNFFNFWLFPVIREKKRLKPQPSIAQALDFRR